MEPNRSPDVVVAKVIAWTPDGAVRYLDQTRLPREEVFREARSIDDTVEAIRTLRIRGAPLIGIGAAMGLVAAATLEARGGRLTSEWLDNAIARLTDARPTAVNLAWAMQRMRRVGVEALETTSDPARLVGVLRAEAQRIWDEDAAMCRAIGQVGNRLIPDGATVMTHCNAGALATGGIGTALAGIYVAHELGKRVRVLSCETRPLRQGARLTAWELSCAGVPVTSVVDSVAASLMRKGEVDLVVTGADRVAANGDVANKIGTYGLAVLAKAHAIPFYVAIPRSTIDLSCASGDDIPIEQRSADEVDAAPGADVYNPAFDVTPASYVHGIFTDRGLVEPPYEKTIRSIFD